MNNKSKFFLILILIGVFGRWVVIPSLKRMEKQEEALETQRKQRLKADQKNCLHLNNCELTQLFSQEFHSKYLEQTRTYFLKNQKLFSEKDSKLTAILRGRLVTLEDDNPSFIKFLRSSDPAYSKLFTEGLYDCHRDDCIQFTKKYLNIWEGNPALFEQVMLLKD